MRASAARGAAGHRAVRRPAARRARPAQRQREPLPAARGRRRRHRAPRSPRPPATLNRYPDREFTALREDARGLPRRTASPPEQVWAANGSNEVMLQLLQAFGGPGPDGGVASRRRTRCTRSTPATPMTGWVVGPPRGATSPSTSTHAVALVEEHRPSVVLLPSPNNPTGTALPPATVTARLRGRRRRRRRAWSSTRRTPSSAAPARRARWSCCRDTRTWSSPAP